LRAEQDAGTDVDTAFDWCCDKVEHLIKINMPVWPVWPGVVTHE
jgi:hypothetical protein